MLTVDVSSILTPLKLVGKLPDLFRSMRSDSLIEYTQPTRVEPIALIDHTIADLPIMSELAKSVTSLYAAYYLQAVALSTNIGNIEVIKILEKLNPSRDPLESFGNMLSLESRPITGLTIPGFGLEGGALGLAIEAFEPFSNKEIQSEEITDSDGNKTTVTKEIDIINKGRVTYGSGGTDGSNTKGAQDQIANLALNLSTGLLLNVEINIDDKKASIPVSVRLISTMATPQLLTQMMAYSAKDKSMKARYLGYKTGELSLKDLMFATDLIDAHRAGLIKDNSGKYAEIIARKNKNRLAGALSGNPSVSTASNIMIISSETLAEAEGEINGSMGNMRLRERVFKDTYLILLVVVDARWEQVTIYHRGIPLPTEIGFKELKSSKSGGGVDVAEMLKLYQMGRNPTF